MDYKEKVIALLNNRELSKEQKEKLENIFPELRESRDKKIKKEIKVILANTDLSQFALDYTFADMISWLEKQGEKKSVNDLTPQEAMDIAVAKCFEQDEQKLIKEHNVCNFCDEKASCVNPCPTKLIEEQKPADKVEPKFKVKKSKWYVCTNTFVSRGKIIAIKGQTYQSQQEDDTITCEDNCLFIDRHDGKASEYFRYWTVQDAKDGDVLATSAGVFIYNGNNGGGSCPGSYCGINTLGRFQTGVEHHWTGKKVYPATKKQRDLLFQKMKEAGYEWDEKSKELKKIEQNSTWSEEDNTFFKAIIRDIENIQYISEDAKKDRINWLESLKERVQLQPKQEWSKDDENLMKWSINNLTELKDRFGEEYGKVGDCINWLKSLRTQNRWKVVDKRIYVKEPALVQKKDKSEPCQGFVICYDHTLTPDVYERYMMLSDINCHSGWKPSEEQIEALEHSLGDYNIKVFEDRYEKLKSLYEQLKKLREE